MIVVVLDGVPFTRPDASIWNLPIGLFESIQLLSASDAMVRYGVNNGEALEVWTKGRGPHARIREFTGSPVHDCASAWAA